MSDKQDAARKTAGKHKSREGCLFDQWARWLQANRPDHGFMYDGIVAADAWNHAPRRILFVLKDYNDSRHEAKNLGELNLDSKADRDKLFNLRYYLQTHAAQPGRWRTWDNVARWAYGLMHLTENSYPDFWKTADRYGDAAHRVAILRQIAVMDLKKKPGESSCQLRQLNNYFRQYPESMGFLGRQLSLYADAEVVVCCGKGVFNLLLKIIDINKLSGWTISECVRYNGRRYAMTEGGQIIIDFRHPLLMGGKVGKDNAYNSLMAIAQEALRSK